MDILTNYIQNGKKLTFLKLFTFFLVFSLLIAGGMGMWLYHTLSGPVFQNFLKEIPEIEIQDEAVIRPENKVWEKELADGSFLFKIDTTRDAPNTFPENGIILTKKSYSVAFNNQIKEYQLPKEKIVIDTSFLTKLMHMELLSVCVVVGIILLILLFLGQASTAIFTSFILWIFKKQTDKEFVRRASFIGWIAAMIVNVALRFTRQGFSLLTCVIIATLIASFCLLWTSKEN